MAPVKRHAYEAAFKAKCLRVLVAFLLVSNKFFS